MSKFTDEQLQAYYKQLNELPVHTQDFKPILSKKQRQVTRKKRWLQLQTVIVTAALFVCSILTIDYVKNFTNEQPQPSSTPSLNTPSHEAELLELMKQYGYAQEINISQTIDGHTMTIEHIVADEYGMEIYFQYVADVDLSIVNGANNFQIRVDGEPIQAGVSTSFTSLEEHTNQFSSSIHINNTSPIFYGNEQLEIDYSLDAFPTILFTIPIQAPQIIKRSEDYIINEQITIDDQQFLVERFISSPLRSQLVLHADSANSMAILALITITIQNEHGEQINMTSSSRTNHVSMNENGDTFFLYLPTTYFEQIEELIISIDQIEVIPKDEQYISFDWNNDTFTTDILGQPITLTIQDQLLSYRIESLNKERYTAYFDQLQVADSTIYPETNSYGLYEQEFGGELQFHFETPPTTPVQLKIARSDLFLSKPITVSIPMNKKE